MRLIDVPVRVILAGDAEPSRPSSQEETHRHSPQTALPPVASRKAERRKAERRKAELRQTEPRQAEPRQADPRPAAFQWRGRTYRVARVIDQWRYVGRWWVGEGEWFFVKVETTDGGLFELYFDTAADEWRLYRIYD